MGKVNTPLLAFNRGIVSRKALARVDVDRIRLSAEAMTNWLPKTQGAMFLRPGFGYLGANRSAKKAIDIPFVAATDDTALLEITDGKMRVWVDDELITRAAVSTAISPLSSATNWTDVSSNGGTVTHNASGLTLNAQNRGGRAKERQQVTVAAADRNKRHAIEIDVSRGPVTFRCGTTAGGDEYIGETQLKTGVHSLALTPAGDFYVQFETDQDVNRIVGSCSIASSGTMELTAPWAEGDLDEIRYAQSADVIFVACKGYQQRRIERRATDSWSVVLYAPDTGPFHAGRTADVKLKPGNSHGNTTLTADKPFFDEAHVGALFRLTSDRILTTTNLAGGGEFTDPIRISGISTADYNDRNWTYSISGTWAGTLRWERSFEDKDVGFKQFRKATDSTEIDITANVDSTTNNDDDDNAIVYYKLGFEEESYTSGAATVIIAYDGDGGSGICRVTSFVSSTQVGIEILSPFKDLRFTGNWQEGIWSDRRGWPTAVALHKGRLWWAGKTRIIGSVSDDYENFDSAVEGDSGPINRTLGAGPVDTINFLLPLSRLMAGTVGSEFSIKSTSFDEPLTPQNTQADIPSTQGSRKGVSASKVDSRGVFVQRSGKKIFELVYDPNSYDYTPRELTILAPDITGTAAVKGIAVQRQPDTRIHFWLSDGTVLLLTYEPDEEVTCWSRIDCGYVEHVAVLPGDEEDAVYYRVMRTIDGQTKRYLEKMALESEAIGGTLNKQADSFIVYAGAATTTIAGLDHLEGEEVIVWADGRDFSPGVDDDQITHTVQDGQIVLDEEVSNAVVGLPYDAPYKSTKLAYAASAGSALTQIKRVNYIGAILGIAHNDGLLFGRDFENMDPLPRTRDGAPVEADEIFEDYDEPAFPFPGSWDADSRLHLRASAPRPCELLAAVLSVETHDKV